MVEELEDARKLGHGTYADAIVVEHRKRAFASSTGTPSELQQEMLAPHVVLELPGGTRVIDKAARYDIDGVISSAPPVVGVSYRLIVSPVPDVQEVSDTLSSTSLRYETTNA